jgi:hypothetical protein
MRLALRLVLCAHLNIKMAVGSQSEPAKHETTPPVLYGQLLAKKKKGGTEIRANKGQ